MNNRTRESIGDLLSHTVTLEHCPLCGGGSMRRLPTPSHWIGQNLFRGGGWGLERCRNCGLAFTNPRPSEDLLERFYSADGYAPHTNEFQTRGVIDYMISRMEHYH